MKKVLEEANLSAFGADEVDAIFDAAQTKALGAVGGSVPKKRKSPRHRLSEIFLLVSTRHHQMESSNLE